MEHLVTRPARILKNVCNLAVSIYIYEIREEVHDRQLPRELQHSLQ